MGRQCIGTLLLDPRQLSREAKLAKRKNKRGTKSKPAAEEAAAAGAPAAAEEAAAE